MNREMVSTVAGVALNAGISVVPPAQDGSKRPGVTSWGRYQAERPTPGEMKSWYDGGLTGVGVVCGAVSGNLECLDFDDRSIYAEFKKVAVEAGLGHLVEHIEHGYLEHSPNGAHWLYRCDEIAGNTKLARRKIDGGWKCLIETRGEGGYVIIAPTYGSVNNAGAYELRSGGINTIRKISPAERQQIHDLARTFDEDLKVESEPKIPWVKKDTDRPGDLYAARTGWAEILEPHGWVQVYRRLDVTAWRRPDKKEGVSATTNHAGSDLMYVFSTSTPFEAERGINKFSAYATLNHGGDFEAAALHLRNEVTVELPPVDLSGIRAQVMGERRERAMMAPTETSVPAELLRVPGMIGEMAGYINDTSPKPQPVLALGAAIAAVATAIGRKVKSDTGLRPNVYVIGVGETGCGKERARQAIRQVFKEVDDVASEMVSYDSMASDAAIMSAVVATPSCLFMLDEVGRVLQGLADPRAPAHIKNQSDMFLRLYGASGGEFFGKMYGDADARKSVDQPSLNLYGTTVPGRLHESMQSDQIADGFLSRMLVFESDDPDPLYVRCEPHSPPPGLVEAVRHWVKAPINPNASGNLEELRPDPLRVESTSRAVAVFSDLEADMRVRRAELRRGGVNPGLFTRVTTAATKLALIRACGIKVEAPEITEDDAVWGAKLARLLYERLAGEVADKVSDNRQEELTKKLARLIKKSGTIRKNVLTRRTQWLDRRARTDILATLMESGQLIEDAPNETRKFTVYRWVG